MYISGLNEFDQITHFVYIEEKERQQTVYEQVMERNKSNLHRPSDPESDQQKSPGSLKPSQD